VKHIDYIKPNLIIVIYYDIRLEEFQKLEKLHENDSESFDGSNVAKKCRVYSSIHDLLTEDWHQKGLDLFPNEVLRAPGYITYSDRQSCPLFMTQSLHGTTVKIWMLKF
jgi:hypothetical protein